MQTKRKSLICIILGVVSIFVLMLYRKPITIIPKYDKILSISISKNDIHRSLTIEGEKEILNLMNDAYSKIINRQSVNDSPNVAQFYTIKILRKGNVTDTFYVYKDENDYFIEKPYTGVYFSTIELFNYLKGTIP
ncbi:DUF5301 domain-containing protein [Vagococcus sp. BWB3-3]|uniref:DUF5301 domain-containing protein n=1 Tax=Vagococcus allomyrinae TaxID=2794353 RepID=A0A940PBF4_9ENTE|nr:DUF5301 domain-containing protein [Vagococcus allomyrinae]MBP1040938.1 DUF5301 domain-containing protein [Vagococcus allomyrinae]